MGEDAIPSIEIVLGLAVVVLGARTAALFQAAIHVPEIHRRLLLALDNHDPKLSRLVRSLGFQSPYADIAGSLIHAARAAPEAERDSILRNNALRARKTVRRRSQRGQALDLVGLALAVGLAAFAQEGLPTTTLFWALGGALVAVLVLTLLARHRLHAAMDACLEQLAESLAMRPSVPPEPRATLCPTCGRELPSE